MNSRRSNNIYLRCAKTWAQHKTCHPTGSHGYHCTELMRTMYTTQGNLKANIHNLHAIASFVYRMVAAYLRVRWNNIRFLSYFKWGLRFFLHQTRWWFYCKRQHCGICAFRNAFHMQLPSLRLQQRNARIRSRQDRIPTVYPCQRNQCSTIV